MLLQFCIQTAEEICIVSLQSHLVLCSTFSHLLIEKMWVENVLTTLTILTQPSVSDFSTIFHSWLPDIIYIFRKYTIIFLGKLVTKIFGSSNTATGNEAEKIIGNEDDYAWLLEIDTPDYLYMRQGVYIGPVIRI